MGQPRETTVVTSITEARRLGQYALIGEIAEGGMGRVYLARRVGAAGFEKLMAVKVMLPEFADRSSDHADMFFDEARIASRIMHPNVATVYDYGEVEDVRFLVMEYLSGQAIMEIIGALVDQPRLRTDPMFYPICARIIAEACEGLHGAHVTKDENGHPLEVIHRDVSPENVFVTYDGAVKVMDFGIAKATGRLHQTAVGVFKGKLPYASPEAIRIDRLDPRADVWAIGVVMWELLTGRSCMHRGTDMEVIGAVLKEPILPPSAVEPTVPRPLDSIVLRALERDPAARFPSARDMARALNRFAVSTGEHIGGGEIAEWMHRIFPGQIRRAAANESRVQKLAPALERAPQLAAGGLRQPLVPSATRAPTPQPGPTVRGGVRYETADDTVADSPGSRTPGGYGFDVHEAETIALSGSMPPAAPSRRPRPASRSSLALPLAFAALVVALALAVVAVVLAFS